MEHSWIHRIYHWVAVPYYLVAGPYYVYQIILLIAPLAFAPIVLSYLDVTWWHVVVIFLSCFLLGALSLLIARQLQYNKLIKVGTNPGFELLFEELCYFVGENQYEIERKLRIQCIVDNIDAYLIRFSWGNVKNISVVSQNNAVISIVRNLNDNYDMIRAHFSDPMRKNDIKTVSFKLALNDDDEEVKPYFSYTIIHPIREYLNISVSFAEAFKGRKYTIRAYPNENTRFPINKYSVDGIIGDNPIAFSANRPRFGYVYRINWN